MMAGSLVYFLVNLDHFNHQNACYNRNRALGLSWVGIPRAQTAQLNPRAYRPSGLVGMSVPLVFQPMTNLGALFLKPIVFSSLHYDHCTRHAHIQKSGAHEFEGLMVRLHGIYIAWSFCPKISIHENPSFGSQRHTIVYLFTRYGRAWLHYKIIKRKNLECL